MITGLGVIFAFQQAENEIKASVEKLVKKNKITEDEAFTQLLNRYEERYGTKIPGYKINKRIEFIDSNFSLKQMFELRDIASEMVKARK